MPKNDFSKGFLQVEADHRSVQLNEAQLKSYQWFFEKGLKEIFEEISPIRDHTGKEFELYFSGLSF